MEMAIDFKYKFNNVSAIEPIKVFNYDFLQHFLRTI